MREDLSLIYGLIEQNEQPDAAPFPTVYNHQQGRDPRQVLHILGVDEPEKCKL